MEPQGSEEAGKEGSGRVAGLVSPPPGALGFPKHSSWGEVGLFFVAEACGFSLTTVEWESPLYQGHRNEQEQHGLSV